jgi:regulator of protease activity HflC (stomatin/prohibitin superfamily)
VVVVYVVIAVVLVALVGVALSVRILKQYKRAVVFRLGRVKGGARGPGVLLFVPLVDRVHRVSLRIITMPIQSQGIITRDNVSVDVSAVAYSLRTLALRVHSYAAQMCARS